MNKTIVTPKTVDEIEFYVSDDGVTCGVSMNGLARLCGAARKSVYDILNALDEQNYPAGKTIPKQLEHLRGKAFDKLVVGQNGAKIVPAKTAARIVRYFAYESKVANDIAKHSYEKFAEIGIETWIKEVTNYSIVKNDEALCIAVQKLIGEVQNLRVETQELKQEVSEYRKIRKTTISIFPGMDACLDMFVEDDHLLPPGKEDITLSQWLSTKGLALDKPRLHKFANLVAETYRTMVGKDPRRAIVVAENGKGASPRNVYAPKEFPILEVALKQMF